MGNSLSTGRGVKRPHEGVEAETSAGETSDNAELHAPKRKRFQSTSKYIVKKLFEEGIDSDITIHAVGKTWRLHKLYLSQCKYFDCMFNRQWIESEQSDINIDISDENIDFEALKIAFKSLYTDNILVKPVQAVGVLAAATFLHLEPLIEHCRNVMKGCIKFKTVCSFYAASEGYGLVDVKEHCLTWLLHCFMSPSNSALLFEITEELLGTVLDSKEFWILQVEVDIYSLLKKWVFAQLNPSWNGNGEDLLKAATDFFKHLAQENGCCFLETDTGRSYIHMFEKVRWMYLITDVYSLQIVKDDQIIPDDWLSPVYKFCWHHHLKVEQGLDTGPGGITEDDFYKWAMRCGRVLTLDQEYHWRWLGYHYGLDLLFVFRNRVLTVKRNNGSMQNFSGSLSQQQARRVMLCVKMAGFKRNDPCTFKSTGIRTLSLLTDDADVVLLSLDHSVKFPVQVTMHLLCINPNNSLPYPCLAIPPPPVVVVPSSHPPLDSSTPADDEQYHADRGQIESGDERGIPVNFESDSNEVNTGSVGETSRVANVLPEVDKMSYRSKTRNTVGSRLLSGISSSDSAKQHDRPAATSASGVDIGTSQMANRCKTRSADQQASASSSVSTASCSSTSSTGIHIEDGSTYSLRHSRALSSQSASGSYMQAPFSSSITLDRFSSANMEGRVSQSSTRTIPSSHLSHAKRQPVSSRTS